MNVTGWEQLLFVCAVTAVLAPLLGRYLAATFRTPGMSPNSGASVRAAKKGAPGGSVSKSGTRIGSRAPRETGSSCRLSGSSTGRCG